METKRRVVLFQGDSITDCGRDRYDIDDLGHGYAMISAALYQAENLKEDIKFINKGISGDKVNDLRIRWKEECIDLQPDVVSIFVGINNVWPRYEMNQITTVEEFKADYRYLLQEIKEKTKAKIIIVEPFVLPVPEDRKKWREDLDPKINAIRELAREFHTEYIPLDGLFAKVSTAKSPEFWAADGIHPSQAGHALIAGEWLKVFKNMGK